MPIDFSLVNWLYVALYAIFVFIASLVGHLLTFQNRLVGAILAAVFFTALFIAWHYYPHGLDIGLPTAAPGKQ